jgi:hypothetical protein
MTTLIVLAAVLAARTLVYIPPEPNEPPVLLATCSSFLSFGDNLILKPVRPNLADAFYALGELHDAFKDFENRK